MPLSTAVIGVGYLGRFHAEKYAKLEDSHLVAVTDIDARTAENVAGPLNTEALTDYRDLFGRVEAVSIVTPTRTHAAIAREFLERGVHVLVEKPITTTVEEADALIALAREHGCILQVGHLERFNPAMLALDEVLGEARFIETTRLAPFKLRATDVNVILDLMIHDIDIVLNMVKAEPADITANGASVLSDSTDIANARLTFDNGCVANVTASRVSLKSERKMRIFQHNAYISVDFQNRILSQHHKSGTVNEDGVPNIESRENTFEESDALYSEIRSFIETIRTGGTPLVTGEDGRRALQTALKITEALQ